jgi:hypothetical protein
MIKEMFTQEKTTLQGKHTTWSIATKCAPFHLPRAQDPPSSDHRTCAGVNRLAGNLPAPGKTEKQDCGRHVFGL